MPAIALRNSTATGFSVEFSGGSAAGTASLRLRMPRDKTLTPTELVDALDEWGVSTVAQQLQQARTVMP